MIDFNEKNKKEKDDNNIKTVPEVYTIKGPNLGDTKTVKIHPGGYVQIIDGGF